MSSLFDKEALDKYVNTTIEQLDEFFKKPDVVQRLMTNPNFHKFVIGSLAAGGTIFGLYKVYKKYSEKFSSNKKNLEKDFKLAEVEEKKKKRINVDRVFVQRLIKILKIAVPGIYTKEFEYFCILSVLLVSRTLLTVEIAELLGRNAQYLVGRQYTDLLLGVSKFALLTIPASAINSGLKYFTNMLALRIRVKLSNHVNNTYLNGTNFYKAVNLGGTDKIDNADQRVTADIEKFSHAIADLYSTIFKPVLDVILFTVRLTEVTGWQGISIMYLYFIISGFIKKNIMPSFGSLTAKESELEGYYRTAHQRIITNSEEIAFYDGSKKEKIIISNSLKAIFDHVTYFRYLRSFVDVFDGLLVKYWASIAGYGVLSAPFIWNIDGARDKTADVLTREYIRNSQYLSKLSTAVGDLVLVGNKITTIAGYTSRVSELLEQVHNLQTSGNKPFKISEEKPIEKDDFARVENYIHDWIIDWKLRCDKRKKGTEGIEINQVIGGGTYIPGDRIIFEKVDIVSPEGRVLARDLNFEVRPHEHVMVTGPNGAGKSSVFRVIGGLWPLHCGTLTKPYKEDVLFIPQKPYLVLGNLRDQIIYPHTKEQMEALGVSDTDLEHLLEIVDPAKLITKTWSWDTEKDWFSALSGGQKQRVAMARLFYHRPLYAILDECTSAVSDEVEDKIYETCGDLGITIFTVSHRKSLARHHDWILNLDGRGGYKFYKRDASKQIIIKSPIKSRMIPDLTLQDFVLNKAKKFGDAPAFIDYDTKYILTFNDLISKTDILAQNLHFNVNAKKGDVLAMFMPNHPLMAVILFGALKAGCTLTTLNPLYTESEVEKQLNDSKALWMVTTPEGLETAKKAATQTKVKTIYVLNPNMEEGVKEETHEGIKVVDIMELLEPVEEIKDLNIEFNPQEDIAILPYSSGTTGVSKGVMLSHTNIVANIIQGVDSSFIREKENLIGILPFYHIYAIYVFFGLSITHGCCTVSLPRFDLVKFLTIVQDYKIQRVHIVPPIVLALAKHPMVEKYNLSSLKTIVSGAAPLSKELTDQCEKRLGLSICQGYGMTESSPLISGEFNTKSPAGGAGVLVPNSEARIVNPDSKKDVGYDEEGELLFRGPNVMLGYLENDEATKITLDEEGWLHTGDIAKIEKSTGQMFILERVKELIKYKGYQVPPAELEGLLSTHPSIADSAVIGVKNEEVGEIPKAFIVLKENQTVSAEEIMEFVATKVAPQKKIRKVEFIEKIPKSASGKILRRMLRDKKE